MQRFLLFRGMLAVVCMSACTAEGSPLAPRDPPTVQSHEHLTRERLDPLMGHDRPSELRGTNAWRLSKPAKSGQIEGYSTNASGFSGATVTLRVSTTARSFWVEAYRIGGYQRAAGRLVWRSSGRPGHRQTASRIDTRTHMVTAPWRNSLTVRTDGWADGFYLFKLIARSGWQAHVPYVVQSRSTAGRAVLMAPAITWQVYNDWGGYSLYHGRDGTRRAWSVSFDRPYPPPGASGMLYDVVPVVAAAERTGVALAYMTDIDLEESPTPLTGARALFSLGHDEYWTRSRVHAVLRARDAGTNLAFLGANTMYWKVRLGASQTGRRRVVVGYRTDSASDPRRETPAATGLWRELGRLESTITGLQYECFPVDQPFIVVAPRWWGFRGTGVQHGTTFEHLVGIEADRVYPDAHTPRPLQVLAHTQYSCRGSPTSTQAVYYTIPSGAGVFTAGTLRWTCALNATCGTGIDSAATRFVRQVTRTVLKVFAGGPAGVYKPARDNLARFDLPTLNTVPAS